MHGEVKRRQRRQDELNNDESSRETRVRVGVGVNTRRCQLRQHTKMGFFFSFFPQAPVYKLRCTPLLSAGPSAIVFGVHVRNLNTPLENQAIGPLSTH